MAESEFDVDASIAAGWERFAAHLADLLCALTPGGTFELPVPVPGAPSTDSSCIRFTCREAGCADAVVADDTAGQPGVGLLSGSRLDHLAALGWDITGGTAHLEVRDGDELEAAHEIADTLERVFGITHPVFLHDAVAPPTDPARTPSRAAAPVEQPDLVAPDELEVGPADFLAHPISYPDEATRVLGTALAQVYRRELPADENDVYTVPAGCLLLFVRAHRSLPLIVFRSLLVSSIADPRAAEAEVATLNRESLWCRYVFDGRTIYAESELVDRVFLPVNFKIQLTEVSAELVDVHADLARRVGGRRWRDLHSGEDQPPTW